MTFIYFLKFECFFSLLSFEGSIYSRNESSVGYVTDSFLSIHSFPFDPLSGISHGPKGLNFDGTQYILSLLWIIVLVSSLFGSL